MSTLAYNGFNRIFFLRPFPSNIYHDKQRDQNCLLFTGRSGTLVNPSIAKPRLSHCYRSGNKSATRIVGVKMRQSTNFDDHLWNNHYESDIQYTFQLFLWILKPIGIYPFIYSRANKLERMVSVVLIFVCCTIVQFVIVPFGYYILFYEKDMNVKIKFLGPLTFCVTSFFKYGYLSLKGPVFERCIEHVERDWRFLRDQNHRAIMIRHVTMSRNLLTLCALFMYLGGLSYHTIMPLLSKRKINENVTTRPLTYPGYEVFFNIQESPTYEIVYCMHCFYVLVTGNITMAVYSLTVIFTSHACGQIEVQSSRLEHLIEEKRSAPKITRHKDRIAIVVRNHVEILRFMKNVEKALQELLLMEIVMSTLLICLLEYYCIMEWETSDSVAILTYVILLVSFTFSIAIYCYVGELLLGQGSKIASASYETDWYNLPGRTARGIVLLLAVTKYPPKLTAGKIFDLSLNTFGVVSVTIVVSIFEHAANGHRFCLKLLSKNYTLIVHNLSTGYSASCLTGVEKIMCRLLSINRVEFTLVFQIYNNDCYRTITKIVCFADCIVENVFVINSRYICTHAINDQQIAYDYRRLLPPRLFRSHCIVCRVQITKQNHIFYTPHSVMNDFVETNKYLEESSILQITNINGRTTRHFVQDCCNLLEEAKFLTLFERSSNQYETYILIILISDKIYSGARTNVATMCDRSYERSADQFKNSNYEHDINYALEVCRWVLRPIGIWPLIYDCNSKFEKFVSMCSLIICFSCLLFFLIPFLYYMCGDGNPKIKVKLLASIIFCLASTINYSCLVVKRTLFARCIEHIKRDWKLVNDPNHRKIMLRHVSISRNLSALCVTFLYSAGLSYHIVMPLFKASAKGNQTAKSKSLAYPVYDAFFDTRSSPTYEIMFCIQFFTSLMRHSITLGTFSLAVLSVTHICGQIQIQISRLENVIERMQASNYQRNFLAIIVHDHAAILRFSKNIGKALSGICLIQIVGTTLIICLLSYYCLKCNQIGPASYDIEWYTLPPKKAYDLILLNAISLYSPKLVGGKIIDLSLNTFSNVLRTAMVYFNLLRTLAD
ncbi:uncharacterized protein LOC143151675 [Ptiloglossa arizonensis]|uniref:uncharacterized protein LOC143151675 n=1 Tax=Ptiloglossa arizonensis TaxID=3350558 RepID=UPI003FA1393E